MTGWPAPRRTPGVYLTPSPLGRREAPRQRFEFSGLEPRPPRTQVRWNEVLGAIACPSPPSDEKPVENCIHQYDPQTKGDLNRTIET